MVIHVGIDPFLGQLSSYDTVKKETRDYKISCANFDDDYQAVNKIFNEIKSEINEELGCACIYLSFDFPQKLRKHFLECGLLSGFQRIHIIDFDTLNFYKEILQSNYQLQNSDTILMCRYSEIFLWKYESGIAKLQKSFFFRNKTSEKDIKENIDQNPIVIFYPQSKWKDSLKKQFPYSQLYMPEMQRNMFANSQSALFKARMMENDVNISHFEVESYLNAEVILTVNSVKMLKIEKGAVLPLTKSVAFDVNKRGDILKVFYGYEKLQYQLPSFAKLIINFSVDLNGIYSVSCIDCKNIKCEPTILKEFDFQNTKISEIYAFPKKIQINDGEINDARIDLRTSRCCAAENRKSGLETAALENTGEPSYVTFDEVKTKCGQTVLARLRNFVKSRVKRMIGIF